MAKLNPASVTRQYPRWARFSRWGSPRSELRCAADLDRPNGDTISLSGAALLVFTLAGSRDRPWRNAGHQQRCALAPG